MSPTDKFLIDEVVRSFFNVFTNKDKIPDFDALLRLCIPEALIIYRNSDNYMTYNISSFIEPRKKLLTDGTLEDFEEYETSEQTEIAGSIAQRFSRYQKSGLRNFKRFDQAGNKLFQLIKINGDWRISSVIWEDDEYK